MVVERQGFGYAAEKLNESACKSSSTGACSTIPADINEFALVETVLQDPGCDVGLGNPNEPEAEGIHPCERLRRESLSTRCNAAPNSLLEVWNGASLPRYGKGFRFRLAKLSGPR